MIHTKRCRYRAALLAAAIVAMPGARVGYGQDDFGGAKTLYVNASYEEALGVLDKQAEAAGQTGTRAAELHHYRALCLIALGRTGEADQAIALSVAADPFSVPDTSELAPRVASVFTAARARLVPDVARAALAEGRQLMQKGDPAGAHKRFEAVTKLLAEPGLAGRADLVDLTLAANAFAELTQAQIAAAAAAAAASAAATPPPAAAVAAPGPTVPSSPVTQPAPSATVPSSAASAASRRPVTQPPPAPRPAAPQTASSSQPTALRPPAQPDPGFVPAVPISQTLPPWQPSPGVMAQLGFVGAVRVTIDETGKVTGAVMDPSVYPPYDRLVLAAARAWTYQPATRNGQAVNSDRLVEIVLRPRAN